MVRVRFAPSPTGPLHIGGARTALFNWLFARHHGGQFILRLEDTDRSRYVPESINLITEGLRWLGLSWDEGLEVGGDHGPYIQSERTAQYREWADWLVEQGHAYRCYCTPQRLNALRKKGVQGYDRRCRTLTSEQQAEHEVNGDSFVVRFKIPLEGATTVHDLIRGDITVDNSNLTDLILMKSDSYPTYHLANVVDDHFMEITHIMRAEEWISTAPVHKLLYDAFGWEMPQIAHMPVILNPNGKGKLSKRTSGYTEDGRKIPVLVHEFQEAGYLPEAVVNFLTNIGWSFGEDREFFTVEETIERFDLSRVNPAGSKFPLEKLDWLNGLYIREKTPEQLLPDLRAALEDAGYTVDSEKLLHIIPVVQERIKHLTDIVEWTGFLFVDKVQYSAEELIQKQMDAAATHQVLVSAQDALVNVPDFTIEGIESVLRPLVAELGLKPRQFFGVLRVAVSGQKVAPPLFETLAVLGLEETLDRLHAAQELLAASAVEP